MKLAQLPSCLVAFTLAGALAVGCGKKESDPQAVPTPSGTPAAVPADPAPAADAGAAATDAAAPTPVTPVTPRPSGGNIDACCAAIAAVKTSGRTSIDKGKAAGAAAACPGIAKRVKDGAASRADGLTQVKALLQGVSVPECG